MVVTLVQKNTDRDRHSAPPRSSALRGTGQSSHWLGASPKRDQRLRAESPECQPVRPGDAPTAPVTAEMRETAVSRAAHWGLTWPEEGGVTTALKAKVRCSHSAVAKLGERSRPQSQPLGAGAQRLGVRRWCGRRSPYLLRQEAGSPARPLHIFAAGKRVHGEEGGGGAGGLRALAPLLV